MIDLAISEVTTGKDDESLIEKEEARILEAASTTPHNWNILKEHRFFLFDEWAPTSFRKATPYGIRGHRMIDLRKELDDDVPGTASAIAKALDGRTWKTG